MPEPLAEVPAHVLDYLAAQQTLSLATASPEGEPHAATMLYASDGATIYIWTRDKTTTAVHLERNGRVSFTIDDRSPVWDQASGVQGSGSCEPVQDGGQIVELIGLFSEKFDQAVAEESTTGISFYRITPTHLRFIGGTKPRGEGKQEPIGADFREEKV